MNSSIELKLTCIHDHFLLDVVVNTVDSRNNVVRTVS